MSIRYARRLRYWNWDCSCWLETSSSQGKADVTISIKAYIWYPSYSNLGDIMSDVVGNTNFSAVTEVAQILKLVMQYAPEPPSVRVGTKMPQLDLRWVLSAQ